MMEKANKHHICYYQFFFCCCFWQYFEVLQKSCSIFRLDFLEIYTIWTISSTFSSVSDKFWKAIKCSRARDFFSILFLSRNFSKIDKTFFHSNFPFYKKSCKEQVFGLVKKLQIRFEMILIFQDTVIPNCIGLFKKEILQ